MKEIKIKFVGFWSTFKYEDFYIYKVLKKHYNVIISDQPDYIICSLFGDKYEYCKYPQPRIMYSGENYIPDLNLVDYAISSYPIDFGDRTFSMPCEKILNCLELTERKKLTKNDIVKKDYFANFISAHDSEDGLRGLFFNKLSKYKRVEAAGTFLNNMDGNAVVNMEDGTKLDLQKKCKFTLCFESTKNYGFITEKIVDAFNSYTIPIYYGSETVSEIFNTKSFINCSDYDSFNEVIEKIKEIDSNDELYLQMINEPILNDKEFFIKKQTDIEKFLCNIFDQPIEKCYRRSRVYLPQKYNDYLAFNKFCEGDSKSIYRKYRECKKAEKEQMKRLYEKLKNQHNFIYMFLWYVKNIVFKHF